jgi:hypothetical protein
MISFIGSLVVVLLLVLWLGVVERRQERKNRERRAVADAALREAAGVADRRFRVVHGRAPTGLSESIPPEAPTKKAFR